MTASVWDADWPPPDYRADHRHDLVVRALTIPCPYPSCRAAVSARCHVADAPGALVHYSRIAEVTGIGKPKRGRVGASTWG